VISELWCTLPAPCESTSCAVLEVLSVAFKLRQDSLRECWLKTLDKYMVRCPFDGSEDVSPKGKRWTKRRGWVKRWKCNYCGRRFTFDPFRYGHLSAEDEARVLSLISKGMDVVDVADEVEVSCDSVYRVASKWADRFREYERSFTMKGIGDVWQLDDMYQRCANKDDTYRQLELDGSSKIIKKKDKVVYWPTDVEDEKTRFCLSAVVGPRRNPIALEALGRAIHLAAKTPRELKADGYKTYLNAATAVLPPTCKVNFKTKKESFGHIDMIESMHRTLRRAIRKYTRRHRLLAFLRDVVEIVRFHYNFIRAHSSLGGHPPGYVAAGPAYVFKNFRDAVTRLAYAEMHRNTEVTRAVTDRQVANTGQLDDYIENYGANGGGKDRDNRGVGNRAYRAVKKNSLNASKFKTLHDFVDWQDKGDCIG